MISKAGSRLRGAPSKVASVLKTHFINTYKRLILSCFNRWKKHGSSTSNLDKGDDVIMGIQGNDPIEALDQAMIKTQSLIAS